MIADTNGLSAILDGDPAVEHAATGVLAIPVIVLGEFRFGASQSRKRAQYQRWLQENLQYYDILPITETTTLHYADIRLELKEAGKPIPSNDTWIAALCRQHSLPLLSRDRHFDRVRDLRRIGW